MRFVDIALLATDMQVPRQCMTPVNVQELPHPITQKIYDYYIDKEINSQELIQERDKSLENMKAVDLAIQSNNERIKELRKDHDDKELELIKEYNYLLTKSILNFFYKVY